MRTAAAVGRAESKSRSLSGQKQSERIHREKESKPRGSQPVAVQVPQPRSPALPVRTQSADSTSGLPRHFVARSFDFTSIEIARRTPVRRGNPSDSVAKSCPACQDTVCGFYQWTASLRSQFRSGLHCRYRQWTAAPLRGSQFRFYSHRRRYQWTAASLSGLAVAEWFASPMLPIWTASLRSRIILY